MPEPFSPGSLPGDAADPAALDDRAVRLAQVDAEERVADLEVAQRRVAGGAVDARGVAGEVAPAAAVDREALDRHVVGAHADDAAVARADEARPAAADEAQRLVDDEVARVLARLDLDGRAGRGRVDAGLERETSRRPAGAPRARPAATGAISCARATAGPRGQQDEPTRESPPRARAVRRAAAAQAHAVLRRLPPPLPPGEEERDQEDERRRGRARTSRAAGTSRPRSSRASCSRTSAA